MDFDGEVIMMGKGVYVRVWRSRCVGRSDDELIGCTPFYGGNIGCGAIGVGGRCCAEFYIF